MRISKFTRIVLMDEGQRYEMAIHELDGGHLDQLEFVAAVERREQARDIMSRFDTPEVEMNREEGR